MYSRRYNNPIVHQIVDVNSVFYIKKIWSFPSIKCLTIKFLNPKNAIFRKVKVKLRTQSMKTMINRVLTITFPYATKVLTFRFAPK